DGDVGATRDADEHDRDLTRERQHLTRRADDRQIIPRDAARGRRGLGAEMRDVVVRVEPDDRITPGDEMTVEIEVLAMPSPIARRVHEERRGVARAGIRNVETQEMAVEGNIAFHGDAWRRDARMALEGTPSAERQRE